MESRPTLRKAFGYQGNALNLPVADVEAAVPFYVSKLSFRVAAHSEAVPRSALLSRDDVQIQLVENGADPYQDGCAFHVEMLDDLRAEFASAGVEKLPEPKAEVRDDGSEFRVFYVVAPDGLCFWFGERVG